MTKPKKNEITKPDAGENMKFYVDILSLYREIKPFQLFGSTPGILQWQVLPKYKKLLTPLSGEEYKSLEKSIKKDGVINQLHILPNGDILCGMTRYEIAQGLGIKDNNIPHKVVNINGEKERQTYLIEENLLRRQLKPEQKAILEYQLYKLEGNKPRKRDPSTGKFLPSGDVFKEIADSTGQSRRTVVNHIKYAKFMEKNPNHKEKRINRVLNHIQLVENKEKEKEKAKNYKPNNDIEILQGDFRQVCKNILDDSVDLILTDPPYLKEYMPLWGDLSEVASRVLKPGGLLITYAWQPHLDKYINMLSKHLKYYWTLSIIYKGNKTKLFRSHNMMLCWKPVLIFYKEPFPTRMNNGAFEDVIGKDGRNKSLHEWQQGEEGCRYLLEHFSKPGDMILEPFAGSGTTLICCKDMKRKCTGIEINKEMVDVIKGRLSDKDDKK